MFNIFELIYNLFIGKNKKEQLPPVTVEVKQEVVKKIKKPRKKKAEK